MLYLSIFTWIMYGLDVCFHFKFGLYPYQYDARGSQGFHTTVCFGESNWRQKVGWNASHMLHVQIITYVRWTSATFLGVKYMEIFPT